MGCLLLHLALCLLAAAEETIFLHISTCTSGEDMICLQRDNQKERILSTTSALYVTREQTSHKNAHCKPVTYNSMRGDVGSFA